MNHQNPFIYNPISSQQQQTPFQPFQQQGADTSKIKRSRKSHKKSRLGCLQCKKKRKKCDEQLPVCGNCQLSSHVRCSYLDLSDAEKQKIADSHQKVDEQASYPTNGSDNGSNASINQFKFQPSNSHQCEISALPSGLHSHNNSSVSISSQLYSTPTFQNLDSYISNNNSLSNSFNSSYDFEEKTSQRNSCTIQNNQLLSPSMKDTVEFPSSFQFPLPLNEKAIPNTGKPTFSNSFDDLNLSFPLIPSEAAINFPANFSHASLSYFGDYQSSKRQKLDQNSLGSTNEQGIRQIINVPSFEVTDNTETLNPLPNSHRVNESFRLYDHKKVSCSNKESLEKDFRPLFDRTKHFTKVRLLLFSLLEKTFINAQKSNSVFFALMEFSMKYIFCKTVLKLRNLVMHPNNKLFHDQELDLSFEKPILNKLMIHYANSKSHYCQINQISLKSILETHSLEDITNDPKLASKVLFKISCMDDVLSWYSRASCYEKYNDLADIANHSRYLKCLNDLFRIIEKFAPHTSKFPNELYYGFRSCVTITSITESMKLLYIPSYNTSAFLEFYDDLVQFGAFIRNQGDLMKEEIKAEVADNRADYYLLIDLMSTIINDILPILESSSSYVLPAKYYFIFGKKWFQLLPEQTNLIDSNRLMTSYRKLFLLYFYTASQFITHIFGTGRYFFIMKSLEIDFLATNWFSSEDFSEFTNPSISIDEQHKRFGGTTIQNSKFIHDVLQRHAVYCLRVVSFFRIRRMCCLRYLNLDPAATLELNQLGEASLNKEMVNRGIEEMPVLRFKSTILKPEHFIHEPMLSNKEKKQENIDIKSSDSKMKLGQPVLRFFKPDDEKNNLYVQDFPKLDSWYSEFGFNDIVDKSIQESFEISGGKPAQLSTESQMKFKNSIISKFNLFEFLKPSIKPNRIAPISFFDDKTGLMKFDFNPFRDLEMDSTLVHNIQPIYDGMISLYLDQRIRLIEKNRGNENESTSDPSIFNNFYNHQTQTLTHAEHYQRPNLHDLKRHSTSSLPCYFRTFNIGEVELEDINNNSSFQIRKSSSANRANSLDNEKAFGDTGHKLALNPEYQYTQNGQIATGTNWKETSMNNHLIAATSGSLYDDAFVSNSSFAKAANLGSNVNTAYFDPTTRSYPSQRYAQNNPHNFSNVSSDVNSGSNGHGNNISSLNNPACSSSFGVDDFQDMRCQLQYPTYQSSGANQNLNQNLNNQGQFGYDGTSTNTTNNGSTNGVSNPDSNNVEYWL